jgi:hypothetical protein
MMFLLLPARSASRTFAALAILSLGAASFPVWPGLSAVAEPAPRTISPCPDFEALVASSQLAGEVWSDRLSYEALCLYAAANVLAASDAAKATDLYALARIRSRYDLARCETWPHGPASSATAALRMAAEAGLSAAKVKTTLPQLIEVARSDATYDYGSETLEQMCDGGQLKPPRAWKAERERIQTAAEAASKAPAP